MNKFAVIMAGDSGARFCPLFRERMPEKLQSSSSEVMINKAIKRLEGIVPISNIYVVTNKNQRDIINQLIINDFPRKNILFELLGQNAAVCLHGMSVLYGKIYESTCRE